jgi:hypothetical protein
MIPDQYLPAGYRGDDGGDDERLELEWKRLQNNVTTAVNIVNHPSHYNQGKIEVIDAIEDWNLDFHAGNVVKYVARSRHKGNYLLDLKKALWYLQRAISKAEAEEGSEVKF